MRRLPGAVVGVAPHSLRAVTPEELKEKMDAGEDLIVVDGDPVADISCLSRVSYVVSNGTTMAGMSLPENQVAAGPFV